MCVCGTVPVTLAHADHMNIIIVKMEEKIKRKAIKATERGGGEAGTDRQIKTERERDSRQTD